MPKLEPAPTRPLVGDKTCTGLPSPQINGTAAQNPPPSPPNAAALQRLHEEIVACRRCPRLVAHCQAVARAKRRMYADWEYWGKPVPSFGDPAARLLVVGLAPAAHGGNRTGRMFTGDSSGDWLVEALHAYGFANQPTSVHRGDGLRLIDAYITAAAHCAPPDNKPTPEELSNCLPFLRRELELLTNLQVVIVLGRTGFDAFWRAMKELGRIKPDVKKPVFAHGARFAWDPAQPTLLMSYHPSRQNTQTGRLTKPMFHSVFAAARALIDDSSPAQGPACNG